MSAYDLRIGMIDGAHKAVALPYCQIDDKPWYCLRRLVEYLECKSVGKRIHRPACPFPYASACAPLTIGHLRFFDPATKIGPCQIGRAFRGLHGEFPGHFRRIHVKELRHTRVWVSHEMLLAFIYRGPHRPSKSGTSQHSKWGCAVPGGTCSSSQLPATDRHRRKAELDRKAGRVHEKRFKIQVEIEKQILRSPLFKIIFEKRKRKSGRDKSYVDLHPPSVHGRVQPHVRLECYDSANLTEFSGKEPLDSTFTDKVFATSAFKTYLGYTNADLNRDVFVKCHPTTNADGPGTRSTGTYVATLGAVLQKTFSVFMFTTAKKLSKANKKKHTLRAERRLGMQSCFSEIHLCELRLPKEKGSTNDCPIL